MLKVGQTVKLMSLEKALAANTSVYITKDMEPYFGQKVIVREFHDSGLFKIECSDWYFSTSWIDTESNPYSNEYLQQVNSISYYNQHSNFLGESFTINGITFFRDSLNQTHILPQPLL